MPAKKVEKKTKVTKKVEKVSTKKDTTASKSVVAKKEEKVAVKATAKKTAAKKTVAKPAAKKAEAKTATKKAETKTTAKKTTAKKATTKTAAKATTKKAEAKKTTAKKAEPKKEVKATAKKAEPKKEVKATTKKASAAKKVEAKTTAKKPAAKKTTAKKAAPKKTATKKATTTKPAVSKEQKEKMAQYNTFSLETCFEMAYAMGVDMSYEQYEALLLDEADTKALAKKICQQYNVEEKGFTFEKDGYDADLIQVIVERVEENAVVKASDFKNVGSEIKKHQKYQIKSDDSANNEEYNVQFDLVRRILMMAQRKDIHATVDMKKLIGENPEKMIVKFMDLAYKVLVHWKYDDVKYYENFIYAVLSQFDDLHDKYGVRAMMDVADLYIEHGDYGLGDANYEYILRENQIKDYIYLRFAKIYYDSVDREKAKSIAYSALQYVDERYTYYPDIIAILEN